MDKHLTSDCILLKDKTWQKKHNRNLRITYVKENIINNSAHQMPFSLGLVSNSFLTNTFTQTLYVIVLSEFFLHVSIYRYDL